MPVVPVTGLNGDPSLAQVMSPSQLQAIRGAVDQVNSTAFGYACAVEWCVCLFTPVWCIFCCHTCIQDAFANGELQRTTNSLNHSLFNGQYVLSVTNGVVYANTDLIVTPQAPVLVQPGQPMYAQQPGQPMYVQQPGQPMYVQQPGQPMYVQQPGQPMYVQQPAQEPQYAQVVDPSQVVVGASPTGYATVAQSEPAVEPMNISKE